MRFDVVKALIDNDGGSELTVEEVFEAWEDERANVRAVVSLAVGVMKLPVPKHIVAAHLHRRLLRNAVRFLEGRIEQILGRWS